MIDQALALMCVVIAERLSVRQIIGDHFWGGTKSGPGGPSVPWQIERYERKFQAAKPGLFVSAIADR